MNETKEKAPETKEKAPEQPKEKAPEQPAGLKKNNVLKKWFGPKLDKEVPDDEFDKLLTDYIMARKDYDMKKYNDKDSNVLGYYDKDGDLKGFVRQMTKQIFKANVDQMTKEIVTNESVLYALKTFPGWPKLIRNLWVNFMGQESSEVPIIQYFHGPVTKEIIEKKLFSSKTSKKNACVGNYCFSYHPDEKKGGILCSYVKSNPGAKGVIYEDTLRIPSPKKNKWEWYQVIPAIGSTRTKKHVMPTLRDYVLFMNVVNKDKSQPVTLLKPVMCKSAYEPVGHK